MHAILIRAVGKLKCTVEEKDPESCCQGGPLVRALKVIDDSPMLIQHAINTRIEVVKQYGELPLVTCHAGHINQVFLNILNNAQQAIEDTGTITIMTSTAGNEVRVVITDDGVGIDPEGISKIFDAGYTTKAVGMGTGLGLSICHQIMQDHGGRIEVASEPGKGSAFGIVLPIKQA